MLPRGAVRALGDTPEVETVRLPMRYIRRKGNIRRAGAATDGATAAALLALACRRRRPFVQRRIVKSRGAVVAGAEEEIRVGVRVGIPLLCRPAAASSTAAELRAKMRGAANNRQARDGGGSGGVTQKRVGKVAATLAREVDDRRIAVGLLRRAPIGIKTELVRPPREHSPERGRSVRSLVGGRWRALAVCAAAAVNVVRRIVRLRWRSSIDGHLTHKRLFEYLGKRFLFRPPKCGRRCRLGV